MALAGEQSGLFVSILVFLEPLLRHFNKGFKLRRPLVSILVFLEPLLRLFYG